MLHATFLGGAAFVINLYTVVAHRLMLAFYPSASGEQPYILPIYLNLQPAGGTVPGVSLPERWALTPPFHPYLPSERTCPSPHAGRRLFSVTLNLAVANNFPLGSAVLCVARTFLSLPKGGSDEIPTPNSPQRYLL